MDLLPNPDQQEIVASSAALLAKELPIARWRERLGAPSMVDQEVWGRCADLGWFGLGLPEERGGIGYTLAEEALLFREIGRYLAPGPFLATVLGARVAALSGCDDVAAAILAGEEIVGLAQSHDDPAATLGPVVSGRYDLVDAVGARYVVAVDERGAALIDVAQLGDLPIIPCVDDSSRLQRATLDRVPASAHLEAGADATYWRGTVLAAAVLVGISEATRDMASDYAKVRVQFGKPIGVNQAIKHKCADMAVRAEAAGSQVLFSSLSVEAGRADAAFQASSAKIVASDAAFRNSADNVQVHGGMGFTFEHDAHLYVKRAHVVDHMLGASRHHQARLLEAPPAQ